MSLLSVLITVFSKVKASGSGPKKVVVNSSGIKSTNVSSRMAYDKISIMSEWTLATGTPMDDTKSLELSIAHPRANEFTSGSQLDVEAFLIDGWMLEFTTKEIQSIGWNKNKRS